MRIDEHRGVSCRTNKRLLVEPFSAIRDHARSLDHSFSPIDFKIIAKLRNSTDTHIGEAVLINKYKPELNRRIEN